MENRIYYELDEEAMSEALKMQFTIFDEQEVTRRVAERKEYYQYRCDLAYDLADKVLAKDPKCGKAYPLAQKFAKLLAEYTNRESKIEASYPSAVVAGLAITRTRGYIKQKRELKNNKKGKLREAGRTIKKLEILLNGEAEENETVSVQYLIKRYRQTHSPDCLFDSETLDFFGETIDEMKVLKGEKEIKDDYGVTHKCYVLRSWQYNNPALPWYKDHFFDTSSFDIVRAKC